MGRLVMGYWDCPICGSKGIPGNVMNCPSCGRARGDVQFYMKDGAQDSHRGENERGDIEYLNEEQEKEIGRNPDWYCSFCNSLNKDFAAFCSNCGASRESSESNYFDQLRKKQEAERAEQEAQPQTAQAQQVRKSSKKPLLILALVVLALILLFNYLNGNTTQKGLKVTELAWVRAIPVEEYREFSESGWTLPDGAEETGRRSEIHHYDQVLDHYENVEVERSRRVIDHYETKYYYKDNGNGSFEEVPYQDPVYKTEYYTETVSQPVYVPVPRYMTKYYYNIFRWVQSREAVASGTDHNARWPETDLKENEREGSGRTEKYGFTVQDEKNGQASYLLAEEDWLNVNVGDSLEITAKRTGADPYFTDGNGRQVRIVPAR